MLRTGLAVMLVSASVAGAQAAGDRCWVPNTWQTDLGVPSFIGSLDRKAAMERMRDSLVGQYRFVAVMTEGAQRRHITESRVALSPRHPVDTVRRLGYVSNVIAEGVARPLREGDGERLQRATDTAAYHFQLQYSPPDQLTSVPSENGRTEAG